MLATIDTTAVATTIKHLIAMAATERVVIAEVLRRFPDLISSAQLSAGLQDAAVAAERQVARRNCGDNSEPPAYLRGACKRTTYPESAGRS